MERKIQKISNSYLATIPKEWIKTFKLNKGDTIYYNLLSNGILLISAKKQDKKQREEQITYNEETFKRNFFRLYLYGCDFIKIKIQNQNQARKIHNYIEQFINVEIIEEYNHYLKINNYDIDTLTPKKCFRQIFFLTSNMYDKLKEIHSAKASQKEQLKRQLKETNKRVAGFYFILIRDVRKHLSNWNFLNEEESLTRYMDFRMAAEKLERIGDILIYTTEEKELFDGNKIKLLDKIFDLNKLAVFAFIKNDCNESDKLYSRANELRNEISPKNNIFQYNMGKIIKYIKDILNLIGGKYKDSQIAEFSNF